MKARKRILDIRQQSRIAAPTENLWFFGEDSTANQPIAEKRKSIRNDRLSILRDDYNLYGAEGPGKVKNKKECAFIVDWQMTEAF